MATVAAATLAACGPTVTRNPLPADLVGTAQPLGLEDVRDFGDHVDFDRRQAFIQRQAEVLMRRYGPEIAAGRPPELEFLAISGGGQYGAYGAGVLTAWTERGDRPEFFGVSGISTGGITAPFAFLGPRYDHVLEDIYTNYSTDDLLRETVVSGVLFGTALADTSPLAKKIAEYITPEFVQEVAAEHRKGRILVLGTTNLDAQRPVIWDMGALAASGHPDAVDLFRDLILASASIPVAFPPVIVPVETPDGAVYDEMHVDGGATSQVTFISPDVPIADITRERLGFNLQRSLYVLMNTDIEPQYDPVRPRLPAIGEAAIHPLLRDSAVGDVYKLYLITERDDIAFHVTWIPGELPCAPEEDFDPTFMRCLFDLGQERLRNDEVWDDAPPFFVRDVEEYYERAGARRGS